MRLGLRAPSMGSDRKWGSSLGQNRRQLLHSAILGSAKSPAEATVRERTVRRQEEAYSPREPASRAAPQDSALPAPT